MFDFRSIKVGWFLGWRQLKRSSLWTTILIVAVMVLTFLNLVVVSGLLVGLIEGAEVANKTHYLGDVIITKLQENDSIENSRSIIATLENTPGVENFSARYIASGSAEANFRQRTDFDKIPEEVGVIIAGINPDQEDSVTGIESLVVEGEYLEEDDFDQVVIGALLLDRYLDLESPAFLVLRDVYVGSKLRLEIGDVTREVTVKGVAKSKVDEIDRRIFINEKQLRSMIGRSDLNVGEISVIVKPESSPEKVRDALLANGLGRFAKIQTFDEGQPKFLVDIKNTFSLLGTIISSVGLAVAGITVFIVIFINAITRRKYIGIMKAIGMSGKALEIAYIFQSLAYAIVGSVIGMLVVYGLLIPYFNSHPINFPFSDGILVAPIWTTVIRMVVLIIVTAIAGYIPARIIVSKNTLDSVLGRR